MGLGFGNDLLGIELLHDAGDQLVTGKLRRGLRLAEVLQLVGEPQPRAGQREQRLAEGAAVILVLGRHPAVEGVVVHDAAGSLRVAAGLAGTGRDLVSAMRDIEVHTRELLVVRTLGAVPPDLRVTPERDARLSEQAQRVAGGDLVRLLELLAIALRAVKDGADPRTRLELALVQAATPEVDASTKALLTRIARLEAQLQGAPAPPPAPAPASSPATARPSSRSCRSSPVPMTGMRRNWPKPWTRRERRVRFWPNARPCSPN